MCDLPFDADAFRSTIDELVPAHQKEQVLSSITAVSEANFEEIGTALTGERSAGGFIFYTSTGAKATASMWAAIKREFYDLFCTNSSKYAADRKDGMLTIKNVVTIVATAVAASFNVAVGVVVGAVTVALMCVLKIGRNAWCAVNKP